MTQVIALLNQKGGVGKTTLAVHLATAFARKQRTVLLLDADPQGSALDWAAARHGDPLFPVVGLPKSSIHKELPALAHNYDLVLIDGPPRVYDVARSAIMASDLVLVPVQPSPYDVWAANWSSGFRIHPKRSTEGHREYDKSSIRFHDQPSAAPYNSATLKWSAAAGQQEITSRTCSRPASLTFPCEINGIPWNVPSSVWPNGPDRLPSNTKSVTSGSK